MFIGVSDSGSLTTCLVVDDEPAILRLVAIVLRELGCDALTARDAESALAVIEQQQDLDFVISDIKLPGMDGLELARRIKSDQAHGKPVLLMSAFGEPRNHEGDAFLAKPFDIDGLIEFVSPYLHAA